MAALSTVAIGAALATALAGTGYQISESQSARRDARRQADEERRRQEKLLRDTEERQRTQESQAKERTARLEARRRQRLTATAGESRADQLLTGPQGVAPAAAPERKTLLGA